MQCEWCGVTFVENARMQALIVQSTGAQVCYECALEWVQSPMELIHLDLDQDVIGEIRK